MSKALCSTEVKPGTVVAWKDVTYGKWGTNGDNGRIVAWQVPGLRDDSDWESNIEVKLCWRELSQRLNLLGHPEGISSLFVKLAHLRPILRGFGFHHIDAGNDRGESHKNKEGHGQTCYNQKNGSAWLLNYASGVTGDSLAPLLKLKE